MEAMISMLLAHHRDLLERLREPTADDPWRVLVSGCLAGWACGVDGSDYGLGGALRDFAALPAFRALPFCPEQEALGTPRAMPDIHGGDGFDVLAGRARILDEHGEDLTARMLAGARAMLAYARRERAELAILTDMSAACGSQVISDGCRLVEARRYRKGTGVATAMLLDAGIPVVSQRDFRTLALLRARLAPGYLPPAGALDHHEHPWTRAHLPGPHPRADIRSRTNHEE
ncbi:MAG TPA: DUF523 domain-containing protein [Thermoanaerobaculia bacterium]|nr:DUF523 domain-containing protein [Thermoanaerobaculia bacterium]